MPLSLELDALLDEEDGIRLPPEIAFGARPLDGNEPPSGDPRPKHRRSRSDPTDWLQSMRGDRDTSVEEEEEEAPSHKRSPSCEAGISPERKRHAPSWMGFDEEYELPKASRVRRPTPTPPPNPRPLALPPARPARPLTPPANPKLHSR